MNSMNGCHMILDCLVAVKGRMRDHIGSALAWLCASICAIKTIPAMPAVSASLLDMEPHCLRMVHNVELLGRKIGSVARFRHGEDLYVSMWKHVS